MRFLFTSDWHVDWATAGYRRERDVERAAVATVQAAVERKVDAYFFLGDLADPDSGAGTVYAVGLALSIASKLSHWGVASFWIAGNHDVIEDGSGRTVLNPLHRAGIPNCTVVERPTSHLFSMNGYNVLPLPYAPRTMPYDPDDHVRAVAKDQVARSSAALDVPLLVVGHLQLPGAAVGSESVEMARGRDVEFPAAAVKLFPKRFCLNGHYHRRQRVGEVEVPGSLERLTFGEEDNRPGFLVVEV